MKTNYNEYYLFSFVVIIIPIILIRFKSIILKIPFYLFLVSQNSVTILACADAPGVDHVAHEDTTVADITRMGHFQYHLHGRLYQRIATNDGQCHTLNHVRRILHATIDPFLTALSDAVYVMVLKPVDVRTEQGLLTSSNFVFLIIASIFFIPLTFLPY